VIPIVDAFNLQQPACIVIVGAGGKTSALFRLARAYARTRPVLVSNTAHLGVEQGRFANRVIRVEQSGDVPVFENGLPEGVTGDERWVWPAKSLSWSTLWPCAATRRC
jgi:hypothetical protein